MIVLDILDTLLLVALSLECFRILQSCSYKPQRGYFKIFASGYYLLLAVSQCIALLCHFFLKDWCVSIVVALATLLSVVKKRKCPLKFTKRIVRMLVVQMVLLVCLCYFVGSVFFVMALPVVTILSWIICLPLDALIAKFYLKKAVKKLSQSNVVVIGITGSYGKTCTKDMLVTMLDNSIAPKGSCNTPLGIAKFINSTDLSHYKYLILEFGARNVGDIRELCKLFAPKYGIVTGICEQHMATFKTLGNVVKTKGELVDCLQADGFCVLNGSDENVTSLSQLGKCRKIYTKQTIVGNIQTTLQGTIFDVTHDGTAHNIHLPQISGYIVDTFLICFEMCTALGQSVHNTVQNCANIKQTPHRMQTLYNGSFYVIDDAYNANIKGVANCCQTLVQFSNYKIALTQGIVEGGSKQKLLNEQCGKMLGDAFDVVIAVGKYAKQISVGANKGKCHIVFAKSLVQATKLLSQYTQPNCIVLFQNDLPDVVSL